MVLNDQQKESLQISQQAEIKKQRFIGKLRPKPGQKVWMLNVVTAEIKEAPMDVQFSVIGKKISNIKVQPNCFYCVAINKENAEKHFRKIIESI